MSQHNDGGPAFPAPDLGEQYFGQRGAYPGMTLRDYFATHANEDDVRAALDLGESWENPADRAAARFRHAAAMLKAREAR